MRSLSRLLVVLAASAASLAVGALACGLDSTGSLDAPGPDAGTGVTSEGGVGVDTGTGVDGSPPGDGAAQGDGSDTIAVPCALGDGGASGTLCAGQCVDLTRDHQNCGGCGLPCVATSACEGACVDVALPLAAMRYEVPCTNDGDPYCSSGSPPAPKTVTLAGTAGKTYRLAIHVRGVVEQKSYNGVVAGSAQGTNASFFIAGGTPAIDFWNTYLVKVSAPAATAYLNRGNSGHDYADMLDYRTILTASAGATVSLDSGSSDVSIVRNRSQAGAAIVIAGVKPAPAAFDGQFVQVDVDSVTLAP